MFYNFSEYLKLAIPSALMLCLEFFGFEALCLVSGFISIEANAAQVIVLMTNTLYYMFTYGISMASTTIVSQLIG